MQVTDPLPLAGKTLHCGFYFKQIVFLYDRILLRQTRLTRWESLFRNYFVNMYFKFNMYSYTHVLSDLGYTRDIKNRDWQLRH